MKIIELAYGGKKIKCHLSYDWNGSIRLAVKKNGEVHIKAPHLIPEMMIKSFLKQKARWIYRHYTFHKLHDDSLSPKEYKEGEIHFFMGERYQLSIKKGDKESVLLSEANSLSEKQMIVSTARPSSVLIRSIIRAWYHEQGVKILFDRFQKAKEPFSRIGIVPESLTYKRMRGKWGTCAHDGAICLNPELIKTPLECIDYVVYHELCHVRHHNHGNGFHALMTQMMPDWKVRRKKLNHFSGQQY